MTAPDLNDYALFAEVVTHGGFAAAGRALRAPKSTLSRRIAALEMRLGVRLIERSTRRFRVTEIGQAFYERCRIVMMDVEQADAIVSEALGCSEGETADRRRRSRGQPHRRADRCRHPRPRGARRRRRPDGADFRSLQSHPGRCAQPGRFMRCRRRGGASSLLDRPHGDFVSRRRPACSPRCPARRARSCRA